MLFKAELTTAATMERREAIVRALEQAGITAYTKTQDNFSGGLFENRRSSGTFGMDSAVRYQYKRSMSSVNSSSRQRPCSLHLHDKTGEPERLLRLFFCALLYRFAEM